MRVGGEQDPQPGGLLVGEQIGTSVRRASRPVERVALAAPVAVDGLMDPASARSNASPPRWRTWKASMTAAASGKLFGRGGLEPVTRLSRRLPRRRALMTCLERSSTMSSSRAGRVPARTAVRSMIDGDVLLATACVAPHVFVDPDHAHAAEPARVIDQHALAFGRHSVVDGVPGNPSPSGYRATMRCWTTRASSAHRRPRRESFARGSAARLVCWRHTCPQPQMLIPAVSIVGVDDPTGQHRAVRLEALPDNFRGRVRQGV